MWLFVCVYMLLDKMIIYIDLCRTYSSYIPVTNGFMLLYKHTVVDCGGLLDPPNGMVDDPVTTFGSQATYTCDMGFTLGNMIDTRTCQIDRSWSGSEPECTGKNNE